MFICHFIISKNPHQGLINNKKHQPKASQGSRLTEKKHISECSRLVRVMNRAQRSFWKQGPQQGRVFGTWINGLLLSVGGNRNKISTSTKVFCGKKAFDTEKVFETWNNELFFNVEGKRNRVLVDMQLNVDDVVHIVELLIVGDIAIVFAHVNVFECFLQKWGRHWLKLT